MNLGGCFHYRVWSSSVANVFPSRRSSSSRSIRLVRAAYKRDLDCTSSPGDPSLRGFTVAELTPLARFFVFEDHACCMFLSTALRWNSAAKLQYIVRRHNSSRNLGWIGVNPGVSYIQKQLHTILESTALRILKNCFSRRLLS
jgi:hypothetical protein